MKAIVLAGGQGSRLWPLSRRLFPKQFLKLGGRASLLQETVRRLLQVVCPADIVIMTNAAHQFHVRADLEADLGDAVDTNVVLEPCMRNTGPALALAAVFCRDHLGCAEDEVLFVSPADHVIRPAASFPAVLDKGVDAAREGYLVTFGIRPTGPETGYGYVRRGPPVGAGVFRVAGFTEKPDAERARSFVAAGGYDWNSGMFAFRIDTFMAELEQHAPRIYAAAADGYENAARNFAAMPVISVDYAVMEKSDRVVTVPVDLYWNDVGSWSSFFDLLDKDDNGNAVIGDVVSVATQRSLLISQGRLIATIGVEDLLVVDTADATLIAGRKDAQKVREVVDHLAHAERPEVTVHLTTYRPWGHYTVLGSGGGHQVKRLVVDPGKQLSLQMHHHRSEHWVVVQGTARVTIGKEERILQENESVAIPRATTHRLANPGDTPLALIEIQYGEHISEDDIVRFADDYGRETV